MSAADASGPQPVPQLRGGGGYRPPRHPAPIDLNLAGNEGATPPAATLCERLAAAGADVLRRYPDADALTAALAARVGVTPEQVLVTAGADEAIDRICRAYLAPGRELVLPVPTFEMFPVYAGLAGGRIVPVPWPDGPLPVDAMCAHVGPDTAIVTVVSPNNPTGAVATAGDLARLSAAAPHALLLVDLAYAEFADEDLTAAALALPNAVVCRSLSKAWGLAGLRIGYALGAAAVIGTLAAAGGPFSVAGPSLALALAALDDAAPALREYTARVREERDALVALAAELGLSAPPSQGNFVLLRARDELWLRDGLASLGIGVRVWPGREELAGCARVSCPGDAAAFERLRRALRATVRPELLIAPQGAVPAALAARLPGGVVSPGAAGAGSQPAWHVVRTAAEARAARAAGAVAIALRETGGDATDAEDLLRAGAARVIDDLAALEELLP